MLKITRAAFLLSCAPFLSFADTQHEITEPMVVKSEICNYVQFPVKPVCKGAYSGYHALFNGHKTLQMVTGPKENIEELIESLVAENRQGVSLFENIHSAWPSLVCRERKKNIAAACMYDHLMKNLAGTHVVHDESLMKESIIALLQLESSFVVLNEGTDSEKSAALKVVELCVKNGSVQCAEEALSRQTISSPLTLPFSVEEIYASCAQACSKRKNKTLPELTRELFDSYFPGLTPLTVELDYKRRGYLLKINADENEPVQESALEASLPSFPEGSWLAADELKMIALSEFKNPSPDIDGQILGTTPLRFLSYSEEETVDQMLQNVPELTRIEKIFEKNPEKFRAVFFIQCTNQWISCVISKTGKNIDLVITDSENQNRQNEVGITKIKDAIKRGLSKKTVPEDKPKKKKEAGHEEEPEVKINYDAPLAKVPLEELPTLEEFLGSPLPNSIQVRMKELAKHETLRNQGHAATKLKNAFLFTGPPGVGKSTIIQLMGRMNNWNMVYTTTFRDAYQGSGQKLINACFDEAEKRLPCIVFIDEMDAAGSRTHGMGSTQEDERQRAALIAALDKHRFNPNLKIFCTTNYPERIDPAILRRFNVIEIPLPTIDTRERILRKCLETNGLVIKRNSVDGVSPDFFDLLVSATKDFSGDALCDMVNNAVHEYRLGLKPEHEIPMSFRCNGINLFEKSLFTNWVECAALPLVPMFHSVGDSDIDKHIYSHFRKQALLKATLKDREPIEPFKPTPTWKKVLSTGLDILSVANQLASGVRNGYDGWNFLKNKTRVGGWVGQDNAFVNPLAQRQPFDAHDLDDAASVVSV